jgi:hypothetical protein
MANVILHTLPTTSAAESYAFREDVIKINAAVSLQVGKSIYVYSKNTTRYTDSEITEILEFSMPPGIPDFDATITKRFRDLFKGTCYPLGCRLHKVNPSKPLIIVRTSERDRDFPYWIERGGNFKKQNLAGTKRGGVDILARYCARRKNV